MNTHRDFVVAAVLLVASASLAQAEVNNVLSEVSTTRLKTAPGSKGNANGKNNAPISTSRSNIKHGSQGIPKQPTCQPGKKC